MDELTGLFEKIGLHPRRMKAQVILDMINTLEAICRRKPFQNANLILDDMLVTVVSAALLEKPFINPDGSGLADSFEIARTLQLDRLFGVQPSVAFRCSILTASKPKEMQELLCNRTFQMLIGCNEYQGVRWYRGEAFQECMYINVLSQAMQCMDNGIDADECTKECEKELRKWLDRSNQAQYRLDNLIAGTPC